MRILVLFGCMLSLGVNCIDLLPDGRPCTTEFRYGVSATVKDAQTGEPIDNAILTLREGDYEEVMELLPTGSYAGAGERPGTYELTIEVPDVAEGTVSDLELGFDGCHVIGIVLEISVQPGQITVVQRSGS